MTPNAYLDLKTAALRRFFSRMNPQQFDAVTTVTGPVLVLAGAGTGKTTVIVNRIANMVLFGDTAHQDTPVPRASELDALCAYANGERDMPLDTLRDIIAERPVMPWQILAITFTNKAAGELKNRLADTLGDDAAQIHAATFHSACVRILRTCIDRVGYEKSFTIYDSDDSLRSMKACMKALDIDEKKFPPKSVLGSISAAKDQMLSPEDYAAQAGNDYWRLIVGKLYRAYQDRLQAAQAVDFDDLICLTVRVFEENPDILEKYQRRYRYILVDEYQDTNYAQYRLVSLLAEQHGNLCVVGDDDQSIYRFRGATIENILQFEEQFPGCKTIRLEENYRSTQHILDAANAVISNNRGRKEKSLWTAAGEGTPVRLCRSASDREERAFICEKIENAVQNDGMHYSDFAVLYRVNALSNSIERELIRCHIPYRIYGGVRFQDRMEIKDVTAYLCVIQNPDDLVRFERIINKPKRGIGEASVANILRIAQDLHMSPIEVARQCADFPVLAKRKNALLEFASMMEELSDAAETLPLEELFDLMLERTGYLEMLQAEGDSGEERIENVKEFRSNIVEYVRNAEEPTLEGFLEETALYTDADRAPDDDCVSLMTMHAAKGLEFDTVFVIGAEQGIFPSRRSLDSPEEFEEERRLAYVTITRAKRSLYFIQCRDRMLYGSPMRNTASQFVKEIPEAHLEVIERLGSPEQKTDPEAAAHLSGAARQMERIRRQRKAAPVSSAGNGLQFAEGDRISDAVFGEGTILRAEPMAGDYLLEVAFDRVGTKKLMAKYRKITKIT